MKVIDLLNKLANGEKTPDRFIYDGMLFERYLDNYYQYYDRKNTMSNIIQFSEEICSDYSNLNDEIEIPEDTPKIDDAVLREYYKKDTPKEGNKIEKMNFCYKVADEMQNANNERFRDFINEIIDKVNGDK